MAGGEEPLVRGRRREGGGGREAVAVREEDAVGAGRRGGEDRGHRWAGMRVGKRGRRGGGGRRRKRGGAGRLFLCGPLLRSEYRTRWGWGGDAVVMVMAARGALIESCARQLCVACFTRRLIGR